MCNHERKSLGRCCVGIFCKPKRQETFDQGSRGGDSDGLIATDAAQAEDTGFVVSFGEEKKLKRSGRRKGKKRKHEGSDDTDGMGVGALAEGEDEEESWEEVEIEMEVEDEADDDEEEEVEENMAMSPAGQGDEAGLLNLTTIGKKTVLRASATRVAVRGLNALFQPEISQSPVELYEEDGLVFVYTYADKADGASAQKNGKIVPPVDLTGERAGDIALWFLQKGRSRAFGDYEFREWNCEHFATFCHTMKLSETELTSAFQNFHGHSTDNSLAKKHTKKSFTGYLRDSKVAEARSLQVEEMRAKGVLEQSHILTKARCTGKKIRRMVFRDRNCDGEPAQSVGGGDEDGVMS